jgi:hypothetical protein
MKPIDRLKGIVKVRGCFRFAGSTGQCTTLFLELDARLEKIHASLIPFCRLSRGYVFETGILKNSCAGFFHSTRSVVCSKLVVLKITAV